MSVQKQFPAHVKSIDLKQGIVTSVVAVFGNIDAVNDRILPGAFTNTIAKWKARMAQGKFLPVVYGHRDDPNFILGKVIDMRQTEEGFEVEQQYFKSQTAGATLNALEAGVLNGSSFSYDIIRGKSNAHGGLDLAELDVIEVGPTMYPANEETRLVGVKAVDNSAWDKDKALGQCETAADYRKVCALEHKTGTPDQRQHWGSPHHYLDRYPAPNADGVRNALSRLPQTQDVTPEQVASAQAHLEAHMREISPPKSDAPAPMDGEVVEAFGNALAQAFAKAGRVLSSKNETQLRQARDLIDGVLSSLGDQGAADGGGKTEEPDEAKVDDPPVKAAVREQMESVFAVSAG